MRTILLFMVIAIAIIVVAGTMTFSNDARATDWGVSGDRVCSLPADHGPCDGVFARWHHNSGTGICEPFWYGGCEGNVNNFETLVECQQSCMDICSLPPIAGPCQANHVRWYFNAFSGGCEKFGYGGCDGNANNFFTLADCENACGGETSPCQMPLVQGACDGDPGWYYDPLWLKCFKVPSGWCGSDINRHETEEACLDSCFTFCWGDLNQDGAVNGFDLLILLSEWGKPCTDWDPCLSTAHFGGPVDGHALLSLLSLWGPCPTEPWW